MIYVDPLFKAFSSNPQARAVGERNGHLWSHLWCDDGEEEQLHEIARRIGMKRAWFQDKPGFPHYDLTPSRRALAVLNGAQPTDLRHWIYCRYYLKLFVG